MVRPRAGAWIETISETFTDQGRLSSPPRGGVD